MVYVPDVFVIGAMKSGTSSFYHNLVDVAELNFSLFKEPNELIQNKVVNYKRLFNSSFYPKIEVSPQYSRRHMHEDIAKRIKGLNPSAKIIYMYRDPIARIISHVTHDQLRHRFNGKRQINFNDIQDQIETSRYYYQLVPYLELFPLNQILLISFEELIHNELKIQNELMEFLEVNFQPKKFEVFNQREKKYLIPHFDLVHKTIRNRHLAKLWHYLFYFINLQPKPYEFGDDLLKTVKRYLDQDVGLFIELFGDSVTKNWSRFNSIKC